MIHFIRFTSAIWINPAKSRSGWPRGTPTARTSLRTQWRHARSRIDSIFSGRRTTCEAQFITARHQTAKHGPTDSRWANPADHPTRRRHVFFMKNFTCFGTRMTLPTASNSHASTHRRQFHHGRRRGKLMIWQRRSGPSRRPCLTTNSTYFWAANDSTNWIYFSGSSDGENWPKVQARNAACASSVAPSACVFQNHLFLFWKANDANSTLYWTNVPAEGETWPDGQPVNQSGTSPEAPSACVFQNEIYLFWKANDDTNFIYGSHLGGEPGWAAN